MPSLQQALKETDHNRWRGMRSRERSYYQARLGVDTLEELTVPGIALESITTAHLKRAVDIWLAGGLKASTVVARLNCLSAMGLDVRGCRPKVPRKLKWWLTPDQEAVLIPHLRANPDGRQHFATLADYIEWTTRTGLRVEETLRLQWSNVIERPAVLATEFRAEQPARTLIMVPGLKTHMAQATLPIVDDAAAILRKRRDAGESKPFDIGYQVLAGAWQEARVFLGLTAPYDATLRAFRRNAARSLHVSKGMPLDMVRQYLRHEHVDTTMGYLRLTGGYGEEEIGKWL